MQQPGDLVKVWPVIRMDDHGDGEYAGVRQDQPTQIGRPKAGGKLIKRCRIRGRARMRSEISKRSCERLKLPGQSKIKMTANCCGTLPVSIARNARSAELARSMIDRSSFSVSILCMSRIVDATCQLHGRTDQYWKSPTSRWRTREGQMGRHRCGGRRSSLMEDQWRLYTYDRTTSVGGIRMPARHVEVRDEERDRHKTRRFTVAESVMKRTHCPLIVPSQATAESQKHQACRA
jgi:hypothetical protein